MIALKVKIYGDIEDDSMMPGNPCKRFRKMIILHV